MRKINWGVLSTAKIARQHVIPGIKKSKNSTLYAIASRDKFKASQLAKKFRFYKTIIRFYGIFHLI